MFAQGNDLHRICLPGRPDVESSRVPGCHHEQVEIRPFRTSQHFPKQDLGPSCTSGFRIFALEYTVQRTGRVVRCETSNAVKPNFAADAPAVTNLALDQNASRVVKSDSTRRVWRGRSLRHPPLPDPTESL